MFTYSHVELELTSLSKSIPLLAAANSQMTRLIKPGFEQLRIPRNDWQKLEVFNRRLTYAINHNFLAQTSNEFFLHKINTIAI